MSSKKGFNLFRKKEPKTSHGKLVSNKKGVLPQRRQQGLVEKKRRERPLSLSLKSRKWRKRSLFER